MKQTKFIEATSADDLTKKVQEAEGDGWEYQTLMLGTTRVTRSSVPFDGTLFLAIMQREKPLTNEEAEAAARGVARIAGMVRG